MISICVVDKMLDRTVDSAAVGERHEEFESVVELLFSHRSCDEPVALHLARVVALASLGQNHLWQDLRLDNRAELSELMRTCFKPLSDKNTKDMKWKKFFYKQICGWEGFHA